MLLQCIILASALGAALPSMDDVHLYLQRGHDGDARLVLQERIEKDPRDIESILALALLEMEDENYLEAAGYLEQVLALDPFDDDSRIELTEVYWRLLEKEKAQEQLTHLLSRHPEWPDALELQKIFQSGAALPGPPSLWSPIVRGDLHFGFDSNPRLNNSLSNTVLGSLTDEYGGGSLISGVSVAAGIQHLGRTQPLTVLAHIHTQQSVGEFDRFKEIMPTSLGMTAAGRIYLGPVRSELHVHYEELFTNLFSKHYHRQIRSTASGSYALTDNNTLQLSVGADVRQIIGQNTDVTARAILRDTLTMGRFSLSMDARLRYNTGDTENIDAATLEVGFLEAGTVLYTEYRFTQPFTLFAMVDFSVRDIPQVLEEATLFTRGGIIWSFSLFDLHSEYSYSRNRSNEEQRNYNRHQFTAGVRFWYD